MIMHGFKLLINEKNKENERSMHIIYMWWNSFNFAPTRPDRCQISKYSRLSYSTYT